MPIKTDEYHKQKIKAYWWVYGGKLECRQSVIFGDFRSATKKLIKWSLNWHKYRNVLTTVKF